MIDRFGRKINYLGAFYLYRKAGWLRLRLLLPLALTS